MARLPPPLISLLLGLALVTGSARSDTPSTDAAASELEAIRTFTRTESEPRETLTPAGRLQHGEDRLCQLREQGRTFLNAHPTDPRRWEAAMWLLIYPPQFITVTPPDSPAGRPRIEVDRAARAAWQAELVQLRAALWAAPDVAPAVREQLASAEINTELSGIERRHDPAHLPALQARLDALAAEFPTSEIVAGAEGVYLNTAAKVDPSSVEPLVRRLVASPNSFIRSLAAGKLRMLDFQTKPLALTFIAVDGREVDLAKLRGKVVLIDFWATWCGPCLAELPNVKKVYAAYHDQGFEVVGISLENAKLAPKDTPEQTAAKLAKARKVLTDFTAKEGMPWVQYFDGKFWKNEIATNYAINAIPATFLLDQEGKLVSTQARGEKLEVEVKRLLKL